MDQHTAQKLHVETSIVVKLLGKSLISHTLCSGFHYETYIGISPYRTLAVVLTEIPD